MGFLSYLAPGQVKKNKNATADEKASPAAPVSAPVSGSVTPLFRPGTGPGNSAWTSRANSMYQGIEPSAAQDLKAEMLVNWMYQQQMTLLWSTGGPDEGVVVKKAPGHYACCPSDLETDPDGMFFRAIQALNVKCAMTINSRVISLFLQSNPRDHVPLGNGLRVQVLPNMTFLPASQRHHFAAFIADRGLMVVWDDNPRHLLKRATDIQDALMAVIWPTETDEVAEEMPSKEKSGMVNVEEVSDSDSTNEEDDMEPPRRFVLNHSIIMAFTLCLCILSLGSGFAKIAKEIYLDGGYIRVAFVVALPAQIWLSLFFYMSLTTAVAQVIGPISQTKQNSKTYSGVAPRRRLNGQQRQLPHVTVQMPVYKEGLRAVIEPTVHSIKAAISSYEMQGGSANIFVNDDGMQLIPEEEARARQDFYDEHNIGWVARPRHDPTGQHGPAFVRAGKFKKASNMNYALWVSNRVEDKLLNVQRTASWTQEDEGRVYGEALVEVVNEDEGRTWADGNIRMGDYILLIDSDTRVPTDCFLDTVTELENSPQVAIIQMNTGVMNVTNSFFEHGITYFTNLVYSNIKYGISNGDVAPFVGHNAFLRWSAVQSISFEEDGREKYWSEATVSEDFDMALRLQAENYVLRYASYFGTGFKEGVSLTVYDELARWEKYAYGCNELVFHPVKYWFTRSPFTPLFRRFICSSMPIASKLGIMAYIGTYYALGSAFLLTILNYVIIGLYNGWLDHYYMDSFKIYVAIVVVFTGLGSVSLAVLRYRMSEQSLLAALWMNLKWTPLITIFFGGISVHISQALVSHMFGIDMNWGATSKEMTNTTFFEEVPKVIKSFKYTFSMCILLIAGMIVMATVAPEEWRITLFPAIYPLAWTVSCHFLLPIVLNPSLMLFTW